MRKEEKTGRRTLNILDVYGERKDQLRNVLISNVPTRRVHVGSSCFFFVSELRSKRSQVSKWKDICVHGPNFVSKMKNCRKPVLRSVRTSAKKKHMCPFMRVMSKKLVGTSVCINQRANEFTVFFLPLLKTQRHKQTHMGLHKHTHILTHNRQSNTDADTIDR